MELTNELISEFVKAARPKTEKKDNIVYGSVVISGGKTYVKFDGSDLLTPITSTVALSNGERVTVTIKDHTAIVTGNMSSPSAKDSELQAQSFSQSAASDFVSTQVYLQNLSDAVTSMRDNVNITSAEIGCLDAIDAEIDELKTTFADIKNADIETLRAATARIDEITANVAKIENIEADTIEALQADIQLLRSHTGAFTRLSAAEFTAIKANIDTLKARNAEIAFANIDFANIGEAWFEKFYANSGIIKNVTLDEGVVVKELIGVLIKGDLIEAGTLKADRLVVKGSDGNYYAINTDFTAMPGVEPVEEDSIHGSVLVKKSIVAEKISVSDLIAFDATIGGFNIGSKTVDGEETPNSIHTVSKPSVEATTQGIYLDSDGQMNVGDSNYFIKFFKDTDGKYKLQITADSIKLKAGSTEKTVEEAVIDTLEVGAKNLIRNSDDLIFESYMFGTQMLDDIISAQNSIIEACDVLTGISTTVAPRTPVTKPDFEDVLDDIIGTDSTGQNGVINKINDLLGGESQ